jgi:hypothetical protein
MTTNKILLNMYLESKETQKEFAYQLDSNHCSINDWLNKKNEMRFSKLEELLKFKGLKPKIIIENIH